MTIEKKFPSGALEITDIVDGQLITETYMGYTKREAVQLFREKIRALKNPRKK
jgi:hypothetical protein